MALSCVASLTLVYVDKPDDGKLIASAINGMVSSLDPHSNYMDAKSFREMLHYVDAASRLDRYIKQLYGSGQMGQMDVAATTNV